MKDSVREQDSKKLIAGWQGESLSNGAVTFRRTQTGDFRIDDVRPPPVTAPTGYLKEFLDKRLTCPPLVVEGRVIAFNWVSHRMPGFENTSSLLMLGTCYAEHYQSTGFAWICGEYLTCPNTTCQQPRFI